MRKFFVLLKKNSYYFFLRNKSFILIIAFIASSTSALRINCNFKNVTWTFGDGYTCDLKNVIDNNDPTTLIINNTAEHRTGFGNNDVLGFLMKNVNLRELPSNIGWRFRFLKGFECDNCGIERIRSSNLERLTDLLHLALPRNKIKKIPSNFFRFSIELQWVYFHNNQISNAGLNFMKILKKIRGIYFANNGCMSDNAVFERSRFLNIMFNLMRRCPPEEEDFNNDTENTECEFPADETSNEKPPKSSSSSSSSSESKQKN